MFNSKYYSKFMFFALIVVILTLFFVFAEIYQEINYNQQNNKFTGFAVDNPINIISNENATNTTNISINNINNNKNLTINQTKEPVIYTMKSYMLIYSIILGIVSGLFIVFSILRSTIKQDIDIENKEKRL